jgi:hypothetical protein
MYPSQLAYRYFHNSAIRLPLSMQKIVKYRKNEFSLFNNTVIYCK